MTELLMVFYLCLSPQLRDCHATHIPWLGLVQYSQGRVCYMKVVGAVNTAYAEPMHGFVSCSSLRYSPGKKEDAEPTIDIPAPSE